MDNKKLIEQINKFIERTHDAKIQWKFINNNLLRWTKNDEGKNFIVTLQLLPMATIIRLGQPNVGNNNYVITIQSVNPPEVVLQVNTANEPELKESLEKLFNEAIAVSKNSSVEILNKLLENL